MTPHRILRVITRLNIGGPSIHATLLSTQLDQARFTTCLVVGESEVSEGDASGSLEGTSCRIIRLKTLRRSIRPVDDLVAWIRLVRIVWHERPHLIHTHMAKAGALGRMAGVVYNVLGPGRRHRAMLVHTFHGHVLEGYFSVAWSRFFITIERWLARWSDRLIAVSPMVKEDLVNQRVAPPEKIEVIPLGLPLEPLLAVDGFRGVGRADRDAQTLVILWVGRLVPIKRAELFLDALAQFQRQSPGVAWRAILAGDGESRAAIEQRIASLNLTARVRCVGWVAKMSSLYADADVVCLTSANEGTPVALIEALAAGKPVIATGVGGVLDVLGTERETVDALAPGAVHQVQGGWVTRSGDADGLVRALRLCAEDPEMRARVGQQGRLSVRERYASTRLLRDIEQLYDRLLDQS